jgi:hypothetical protein
MARPLLEALDIAWKSALLSTSRFGDRKSLPKALRTEASSSIT